MNPDQEVQEEIQYRVQVGVIEIEIKNLTNKVDSLGQQLRSHMAKEEQDRKDLDKKLNIQTYILIAIAVATGATEVVGPFIGM